MEQHPVPQNISGFQFKLIGDMTVRQFGYLAAGVLTGYVILQLDWPSLIKWFLAALVAGGGFAFAFVPIEERPLDRWVVSFFKSIYAPTQFLWKKRPAPPEILTATIAAVPLPTPETLKKEAVAARVEEYLTTLPTAPKGALDQKEEGFLAQISSFFAPSITSQPVGLPPVKPEPEAAPLPAGLSAEAKAQVEALTKARPPAPAENLDKKTQDLTGKISALEQELSSQTITKERFLEIQSQLTALLKEKERLSEELVELKRQLTQKKETAVRPTVASQAPEETTVKIVSANVAPKIGMPKPPTVPNTISGIVKTQKGMVLPGILVEIRNPEGTPVRALKTGKLGQFSVSTPLPNGTFTLHLEDPQQTFHFDLIEVALDGGIVSPLEIFAKTQKDTIREELTKKLFSTDKF